MNRGSVLKALGGVACAALLACVLVALSGTAVALQEGPGGGAGEPPGAADPPPAAGVPDAAAPAPPSAAAPEGGSRRDRRQQLRRLRRFGQPPQTPDAGAPPDAGARDAAIPRHDAAAVRPDAAPPFRFAMRDGGMRPFAPPRPPPVAAPPPPPPLPQPTGPSTSLPVTELGFNTCQRLPAGKRAVKMNLKPEVELPELVAWISSITCKSFVLPGHLSAGGKKLTFVTQGTMTPTEAYAAFLTALDSVGLTVERGHGYNKIIETTKAKMGSTPVYGFDGKITQTPPKRTKSSAAGN